MDSADSFGIYRSEVLKDFKPENGATNILNFGSNSITGWRISQEVNKIIYLLLLFIIYVGILFNNRVKWENVTFFFFLNKRRVVVPFTITKQEN